MAGATVWRGIEGFRLLGAAPHRPDFPIWLTGLPLAVEVIDTPERVEAFRVGGEALGARLALVTRESVHMSRHEPRASAALDDLGPHERRASPLALGLSGHHA